MRGLVFREAAGRVSKQLAWKADGLMARGVGYLRALRQLRGLVRSWGHGSDRWVTKHNRTVVTLQGFVARTFVGSAVPKNEQQGT
jgi:hypothetical protein